MDNELRITPEDMGELEKGQIFVFGSNESGIHGAGAAAYALKHFGAQPGKGWGLSAACFAIPTKDWVVDKLPLDVVAFYVKRFIAFTQDSIHYKWKFMVTRIGCGLAGFTPEEIAPLFKGVRDQKNIWLPQDFHDVLDGKYIHKSQADFPITL